MICRVLLPCFIFLLAAPGPLRAQTVRVVALEVGVAEYAPFIDVGTSLVVWVDTQEAFVRLDGAPDWQLRTEQEGVDLVAASTETKAAYDAETARMARQGRHRFSSEMEYAIRTGEGRPARDTSGFTFEIETIAPPPAGSRVLRLTGPLAYIVATTDTMTLDLEIDNLYARADRKEALTHDGIAFTPYLTGASYGDDQEYRIEMEGYHPVAFAVDGKDFENGLYVPQDIAAGTVPLRIRVVATERRTLPLELEFGIGL